MKLETTTFVAASAAMTDVVSRLRRVAPTDSSVLLQGESGTGKEVAARLLHDENPRRRSGPLVSVHCGAMPEALLESELFGHVRGAFTGADRDRIGRLEQADGGTLFLDEISTMTPEAQIRLLRVLQERRVTRIGSTDSRAIDVRVVAATNQDLDRLVADGRFRLDLLYRINTYPVTIPPLRERPGDIGPLAEHFATRVAERIGIDSARRFTNDALSAMGGYHWPGNVRELENAIEYASIECGEREVIDCWDLPATIGGTESDGTRGLGGVVVTEEGVSFRTAVTNLERELILQSMRLADGNKARAAELLDLKRTTFLEKLRRLEIEGSAGPIECR